MAEQLDAVPPVVGPRRHSSFACGKRAPPEVVPGTPQGKPRKGTVWACFPRQSSGATASRRPVEAVPARPPPFRESRGPSARASGLRTP